MHVQRLAGLPWRIIGEAELGQALQQVAERNASFQSRQRRAETEVDAMAEGEVGVRLAADVKPLGGHKVPRIAIGRADDRQDKLSRGDGLTVQIDRARRGAKHPLDRRAVAQDFLDRSLRRMGERVRGRASPC